MKINKRIAISFITIAGVLTAVVGITLAQFSDDAALVNNTLSTGSAELRIATATGGVCSTTTYDDSITGIQNSHVAPGQANTKQFCLKNNSDSSISLDVNAIINIKAGNTLEPSLVAVDIECGSGPVSGALNSYPATKIVTIAQGVTQLCSITQTLSGTATNSAAKSSVAYDVVFTGTQVEP